MCTYNGAVFLTQQLESIAAQTTKVDEIVICDDGSTDDTCGIVDAFARQHPGLVRLYRNPVTLGYSQNFGLVLSLCHGEIIFLCDQDDVWLPMKVEKMAQLFANNDECGVVSSSAIVTDRNLNPGTKRLLPPFQGLIGRTFAARIQRSFAYGCTLALRGWLLPLLLPISPQWSHDNWICFLAPIFVLVQTIEEPLMLYRRHASSAGLNDRLDLPVSRELVSAFRKTTELDYRRDSDQWKAMHEHLHRLFEHDLAAVSQDIPGRGSALQRKDTILNEVAARLEFADERRRMTARPRPLRLLPALRMLASGRYHEFVSGYRSLMKDLITA
jgi:glycosyltransferase involved in cell wall biosynthesis